MRIKDYDILMIQESWQYYEEARTYNSRDIDFTLKDNKEKTCFYVNNCIDDNNWYEDQHNAEKILNKRKHWFQNIKSSIEF